MKLYKTIVFLCLLLASIKTSASPGEIITGYNYVNLYKIEAKFDTINTIPKDSGSFSGVKFDTIAIENNPQTVFVNRQSYAVYYFDDSVTIAHSSGARATAKVMDNNPITMALKGNYKKDQPHYWDNYEQHRNDTTFGGDYRLRTIFDTLYRYYAITHYTDIDSVVFTLAYDQGALKLFAANHANTAEYTDYIHEIHSNYEFFRDSANRAPYERDTILEVPLVAQTADKAFWAAAELSILGYQRYEDVTNCQVMEVARLAGGIVGANQNCCEAPESCNETINPDGAENLHEYFDLAKVRVDSMVSVPEIQRSLNLYGPVWIGITNQANEITNALVLHGIKDSVCYLMNPVSGQFETKHYKELTRNAYGKWSYTLAPRFSRLGGVSVVSPAQGGEYINPVVFSFSLDTAMNGYHIRLVQNGIPAKDTSAETTGACSWTLGQGENYGMVARGFKKYTAPYVGRKFGTWTRDTVDFRVSNDVGTEDEAMPIIKAFPNPTSGTIELTIDETSGRIDYELVNLLGLSVLSGTASGTGSVRLDISARPQGVYFLSARNASGQLVGRIRIVKY